RWSGFRSAPRAIARRAFRRARFSCLLDRLAGCDARSFASRTRSRSSSSWMLDRIAPPFVTRLALVTGYWHDTGFGVTGQVDISGFVAYPCDRGDHAETPEHRPRHDPAGTRRSGARPRLRLAARSRRGHAKLGASQPRDGRVVAPRTRPAHGRPDPRGGGSPLGRRDPRGPPVARAREHGSLAGPRVDRHARPGGS